ncbi:MAG: 4Fe-4S dicluster domain-containing protein [Pedosphaera sp.]|nr:4Fe-4S dicluster domain-containing protein [Pedosphaera sp.]
MSASPGPSSPFLDETKALACVHCGLCLGSCPTYLETGNENDSPRGRIYLMRSIQAGRTPLAGQAVRHLDLCLGCRACETACPSGVEYGHLLEATRDHIERNFSRSTFQTFLRRVAIERVFPYPWRMQLALLPALLLKRLHFDSWLPKSIREMLALVPHDCSRAAIPEISPVDAGTTKCGRVGFISGCVMSVMFGRTHQSSVRLLNSSGFEVVTPRSQVCCGALYAHGGNLEQARANARINIELFERLQLDAVIINAAGCGSTLKDYGSLLSHDPAWAERARRFSALVKDLSEFLAAQPSDSSPVPARRDAQRHSPRVTFHDACHLAHAQRITKPPRDLIRGIAGRNFVELTEADLCCGSAGSYNLTEPEMAGRLQERKAKNIIHSGAEIVITTNPGCILQLQAGLTKAGAHHIRVMHIADYLAEAMSSEE